MGNNYSVTRHGGALDEDTEIYISAGGEKEQFALVNQFESVGELEQIVLSIDAARALHKALSLALEAYDHRLDRITQCGLIDAHQIRSDEIKSTRRILDQGFSLVEAVDNFLSLYGGIRPRVLAIALVAINGGTFGIQGKKEDMT